MSLQMQTFLEKYYQPNETIILGCSAWPDSMYVLYHILETSFAQNLVVAYFNHKTRPETDEEEAFLETLSQKKWFKFETASCNFDQIKKLYPSKSFEELAREKRYQFFSALMNIHHSQQVITAHHLDDKIETFFFNMLRWTKLSGLTNMKESHGWVLRPLLHTEKKDILNYLDQNNLEYKIDSTNSENIYSRNKIRNEVLPKCEEIKWEYRKNIDHLMYYLEQVQEHLDSEVEKFLTPLNPPLSGGKYEFFEIPAFKQLSPFLQKEVIRYIYYIENGNSTIGLSEWNIAEILRFIDGKNNKTVKEIQKLKMTKDNKKIIW